MGNLWSVTNALSYLGAESEISFDTNKIANAEFLIIPGVGSFKLAMQRIKERKIDVAVGEAIKKRSKILGICLGLQLLGKSSEEDGGCMGLNLVNNEVKKINSSKVKVPHVGFNAVSFKKEEKIFSGLKNKSDFYFNHSYCMSEVENETTTSTCKLDGEFISSLSKKNIFATQFHPEKSQSNGLVFLKNFLQS